MKQRIGKPLLIVLFIILLFLIGFQYLIILGYQRTENENIKSNELCQNQNKEWEKLQNIEADIYNKTSEFMSYQQKTQPFVFSPESQKLFTEVLNLKKNKTELIKSFKYLQLKTLENR